MAAYAFVERNLALLKKYLGWELMFLSYSIVNTLTIGLIMVQRGSSQDVLYLVMGALLWGFLSIMMREVSDAVGWERWEGTIEYTFMAPIRRITHLFGSCIFAILYGMLRMGIVLALVPIFFDVSLSQANLFTLAIIVFVSSFSFMGMGLIAGVLPLLSPEKGSQATGIIQSGILLISGVYYEIDVLPKWIQPFSKLSPATYTLRSARAAVLEGASIGEVSIDLLLLLITGILLIPLGLWVFQRAEVYAKKAGKLKRSG